MNSKKSSLKLEDFAEYRYLSGLTASPDGKRVGFIVSQCDYEKNTYRSNIYIFDRFDRSINQLTGAGKEKSFIWLDNDRILFPSLRAQEVQDRVDNGERLTVYYTISLSGGEALEYMQIPLQVKRIWRLDNERYVILALYQHGRPDPMQAQGDERKRLLREELEQNESYLIAEEIPYRLDWMGYTNGLRERLYIFDRSNQSLKPITDETEKVEFCAVNDGRIFFSARHYGKEKPLIFKSNLAIYDINSGKTREYVDEDTFRIRYLGFAGETPVFMGSTGERFYYQENPWFYEMNEETGDLLCLAENEFSAQNAVGTDCRYGTDETIHAIDSDIYFVGTVGGDAHLKRLNRSGVFETLTAEGGAVDAFAVCEDEVILIAFRQNRLQELYSLSLKDRSEKRLSDFNEWVQDTRTLSTPELIHFENDGQVLDGWVMTPAKMQNGIKYPAILYIHGGHKLCYGAIFFHELQLYANLGYFVIYANPRGSDGSDNVFADVIGNYGITDYDDLMAFCDVCLERFPPIDSARFGVGGGSYGGYMTNWIIGHTNRFACAASQRSIASFVSMFGTSDTSYQFPLYDFDSDPWHDIDRYWFHSPLKYADRVSTPTLFIHSSKDYRCPVSEAEQMFTALKYHGIEARLCVFQGEGHDLSRNGKPKNRRNRLLELIRWFERYLMPKHHP